MRRFLLTLSVISFSGWSQSAQPQALQPRFLPQTLVDYGQVVLAIVTIATLVVLCVYTKATVDLRKATREQVDVSNRLLEEAQKQTEHSLMPVVELVTTTTHQGHSGTAFVLRNTGKGPAFNTTISPLADARGTTYSFRHKASIAAGDGTVASLYIDSQELEVSVFINFLQRNGDDGAVQTSIVYQSVTERWYETSNTPKLTPDGRGLTIQFDRFTKLERPPARVQLNAV